jgi:hypothetical protein
LIRKAIQQRETFLFFTTSAMDVRWLRHASRKQETRGKGGKGEWIKVLEKIQSFVVPLFPLFVISPLIG